MNAFQFFILFFFFSSVMLFNHDVLLSDRFKAINNLSVSVCKEGYTHNADIGDRPENPKHYINIQSSSYQGNVCQKCDLDPNCKYYACDNFYGCKACKFELKGYVEKHSQNAKNYTSLRKFHLFNLEYLILQPQKFVIPISKRQKCR